MSTFVIAGKDTCPARAHAVHVSEFLAKTLPNFKFISIVKSENEWPYYIDNLNTQYAWHVVSSLVIWKEITHTEERPYLIGGLSEFWEYCYDYYGFESNIPKADLADLVADGLLIAKHEESLIIPNLSVSIITESLHSSKQLLIGEVYKNLTVDRGIQLKIYIEDMEDPDELYTNIQCVEELNSSALYNQIGLICTLTEAVENCDLLLITNDQTRDFHENLDDWLHRCRLSMLMLADEINKCAKRNLRVIFCQLGPVCFNASILIKHCTTIRAPNIVAITADEGISAISIMEETTNEPTRFFGCPPVWGFTGISSFVDVCSTVIIQEVYRPLSRTLALSANSNLSQGTKIPILRRASYLFKNDEDIHRKILRKQSQLMPRPSWMVKIRALGKVVAMWYSEKPSDEIICLGVCSNGSFGFPAGVVFSQTVILNEKYVWEILPDFPISSKAQQKITEILKEINKDVLERYFSVIAK